jgi:hypothetical protein
VRRIGLITTAGSTAMILAVAGCSADPWTAERSRELGIDFRYHSGANGEKWLPEIMGAGVALIDIDNDGLLDLYFANGNDRLSSGEPDGSESRQPCLAPEERRLV